MGSCLSFLPSIHSSIDQSATFITHAQLFSFLVRIKVFWFVSNIRSATIRIFMIFLYFVFLMRPVEKDLTVLWKKKSKLEKFSFLFIYLPFLFLLVAEQLRHSFFIFYNSRWLVGREVIHQNDGEIFFFFSARGHENIFFAK